MTIPNSPACVVTGAGSGLGRALCVQLAKRGARVIASDVNEAGTRETLSMLGGAEGHFFKCDVSKREEVVALAAFADERFGAVDFVANNAGVAVSGNVGEVSAEHWEWIVGVNLWGVIWGCDVFLPGMKRRGRGHILNVASLAAIANAAGMAPYNVTKSGVLALSETLHGELKGSGVGVSALCPSFFPTNIMNNGKGAQDKDRRMVAKLMARSPFSADDIARISLDACQKGTLHILPHAEGRWLWRMRRLFPQRSLDLATGLRPRVEKM